MLLSSLSLHTLALQARQRALHQWQLARRRDALLSAAMQFAQRSRGTEACLLAWPSEQWPAQAACPAANPELLLSGAAQGLRWRLRRWQPGMPLAQLSLELPDLDAEGSVTLRVAAGGALRFERFPS